MYVGGSVEYVEVSENLSYFQMFHVVRELGCAITNAIWFRVPGSEMKGGLRLIDNNNTLDDMFKIHQEHNEFTVELFVQDVMQYEIDIPPLYLNQTNELGDAADDLRDWGSIGSEEEEIEGSVSDFEYFAEGDTLSDNCDPLGNEEVKYDEKNVHPSAENSPAFTAAENEVQSDPEQLTEPSESEEEGTEIRFPNFVEDMDMKVPDLEEEEGAETGASQLSQIEVEEERGQEEEAEAIGLSLGMVIEMALECRI
ncbi:hypothetical protein Salat_1490800 [Sesamum alatum]|uniref:PB1-like domain-containing protein n=1 Tax=Sesamum alatum TaxID=300844 RepID=A0AAE2CME1_9LAMI|nr:hypothetical protein Salat_1490800 [Sesamum alatum]